MKKFIPIVITLFFSAYVFGQRPVSNELHVLDSTIVYDIDGNSYNTVKIGRQIWLGSNLRTTSYSDGLLLPNAQEASEWNGLITGACCFFNNDQAKFNNPYGALYNWYAVVDRRNLCPKGWHIPTDKDWRILETYLGRSKGAGGKLKETGYEYWISPNAGATNVSGFSAISGGIRYFSGPFSYLGGYGYWWSSTESLNDLSIAITLSNNNENMVISTSDKGNGYSVRCIKNE